VKVSIVVLTTLTLAPESESLVDRSVTVPMIEPVDPEVGAAAGAPWALSKVANDRATHALRNARCILTRAGFDGRIWREARIDGMKSGVFIGWIRFGLVGEGCRQRIPLKRREPGQTGWVTIL